MTWVQRISIIIFFFILLSSLVCLCRWGERERGKQRNSTHTHSTQFIINYENYSEHDSFLHMISFTFPRFSLWNRKRIVFPHPNRWKFSVSGFENFDYSSESFFYFVKTYLQFKKKSQCFWRFFRKFVQFWLLLQKKDDLNHFCRIHVTVFNALELPFPFAACKINVHCVLIHYTESSLVTYFGKLCKICNNPFPELRRYFWLRWDLERQIN